MVRTLTHPHCLKNSSKTLTIYIPHTTMLLLLLTHYWCISTVCRAFIENFVLCAFSLYCRKHNASFISSQNNSRIVFTVLKALLLPYALVNLNFYWQVLNDTFEHVLSAFLVWQLQVTVLAGILVPLVNFCVMVLSGFVNHDLNLGCQIKSWCSFSCDCHKTVFLKIKVM